MTAIGTLVDRVTAMVDRLNAGDLDGCMSEYSPAVVPHGYPESVDDVDSLRGLYAQLLSGLDGLAVELLRTLEQGDIVAARFVLRGRHVGELFGSPPTGRDLDVLGASLLRFHDGYIVERRQHADDLGLLQQLGLLPPAVTPQARATS